MMWAPTVVVSEQAAGVATVKVPSVVPDDVVVLKRGAGGVLEEGLSTEELLARQTSYFTGIVRYPYGDEDESEADEEGWNRHTPKHTHTHTHTNSRVFGVTDRWGHSWAGSHVGTNPGA
eukprot:GHVU01056327.1.p2 GENE.GHVU01056327.1~~GHVU01056327.1.p2  ORF type:complete len:119 (+),score=15.70 GHVU01056327.1:179-535(+)